jgi:hypothetical protein
VTIFQVSESDDDRDSAGEEPAVSPGNYLFKTITCCVRILFLTHCCMFLPVVLPKVFFFSLPFAHRVMTTSMLSLTMVQCLSTCSKLPLSAFAYWHLDARTASAGLAPDQPYSRT